MKYMLLIYHNPGFLESFSEDEMNARDAGGRRDHGRARGVRRVGRRRGAGRPVADEDRARRATARRPSPTGPFVEAKEYLAGYCIVDCETPERAVEIAARWPDARWNGVEVRPSWTHSGTEM